MRIAGLDIPLRRLPRTDAVYLTFDDGPDPHFTPQIIEILRRAGCRASFFCLSSQLKRHPDLCRAIHCEEHSLGLHGESHRPLLFRSRDSIERELLSALSDFRRLLPEASIRYLRPPFGLFGPALLRAAHALELRTVLWSVNSGDYRCQRPREIVERVCRKVRPGSIVLLHDGGAGGQFAAAALPQIIECIRAKGLRPLPLP